MFIELEEMKSAIYAYQIDEITENDTSIILMAINAAIEEMRSYLTPNNQTQWNDGRPRYDVEKIFSAVGTDRNPLILELCKNIAVYYACRLSNVDIIYERVQTGYSNAIDWLEKASGTGKYADSPVITPNLPVLQEDDNTAKKPFRFGSREKFEHDF